MFSFLKRRELATPAAPVSTLPVFAAPQERGIFHFWDGTRNRNIDPLAAWEVWRSTKLPMMEVLRAADAGDGQAQNDVVEITRQMFGVKEYNPETGEGLTRDELNGLLATYLRFVGELKKKPSPWQTQLPLSEPAAEPAQSSTFPDSTTLPESESTSPPSESSAAEPTTPLRRSIQL